MNPNDPNNDPNAVPPVQPDVPAPQPAPLEPAPQTQQPFATETPAQPVAAEAPAPIVDTTQAPADTPVFDQSPSTPPVYETPVAQPVAPVAPQPTGPIIGSGPEVPGATPAAPMKSNGKLFIIIGAIVGGLALIGGGIFLIISLLGSSLPLKEYQADDYSILVPETYFEKVEGPTAQFSLYEADDEENKDKNSVVIVSGMEYNEFLTKEAWLKLIDENFTKDKIQDAGAETGSSEITKGYTYENVTLSSEPISGSEARAYKADVLKDGQRVGTIYSGYVFGDEKLYLLAVLARQDSPGLAANAEKIFTSFKINE